MVYGLRLAPTLVVFWDQRWTATKDPGTFLCQDHSSWRLVWCPRLNWAPRRKKKKGRGGTLSAPEGKRFIRKQRVGSLCRFPSAPHSECRWTQLHNLWTAPFMKNEKQKYRRWKSFCLCCRAAKVFSGWVESFQWDPNCCCASGNSIQIICFTMFKCNSVFFLQLEYFFVFFVDSSVITQFWKQRSRVQSLDPRIRNVLPTKRCTFFWILKENITFHLFLYPTYPN